MLKNLEIVAASHMKAYVMNQLIQTKEVKGLIATHPYFQRMMNVLAEGHLAVYEIQTQAQRNHLTSHARLIGRRHYQNPYIQDLYYIHELAHAMEFNVNAIKEMSLPRLLSKNELYASLVSEAFIYFFEPRLIGQTFHPLWATHFMDMGEMYKGFWCRNRTDRAKVDFMCSEEGLVGDEWLGVEGWPSAFMKATERRLALRANVIEVQSLLPGEDLILSYNEKREKWVKRWNEQGQALVEVVHAATEESMDSFKRAILKHTDPRGICFPLAPLLSHES
jgi:hypothetical protein